MTKKTLVKVFAILLVVAALGMMFVGCKPKTISYAVNYEDIQAKLINGMEVAIGGNYIDNLSTSAKIELETQASGKTKNYSIDLAFQLDLDKDAATHNNGIKFVVKENNATKLGIWYQDYAETDTETYKNSNFVYMQHQAGGEDYKLAITAPDVKSTLIAKEANINGAHIDGVLSNLSIGGMSIEDILGFLGMVATDCEIKGDVASFNIPLTKLLLPGGELEAVLGSLDISEIMMQLGLGLDLQELFADLPDITLSVAFRFVGDMMVGCDIGFSMGKADFGISHANIVSYEDRVGATLTKKDGEGILAVKLDNDVKMKLSVSDLKIGKATLNMNTFQAPFNYTTEGVKRTSALNAKITGQAVVANDINVSLDALPENVMGIINTLIGGAPSIKKGTYDMNVEVDIDPTALIDSTFEIDITPYYLIDKAGVDKDPNRAYLNTNSKGEVVLPENVTSDMIDAQGGVKWVVSKDKGINDIKAIASTALSCINHLEISFTNGAKKEHITLTEGRFSADFFGLTLSNVINNKPLATIVDTVVGLLDGLAFNSASQLDSKNATGTVYGADRTPVTPDEEEEIVVEKTPEQIAAEAKAAWTANNNIGDILAKLFLNISDANGIVGRFDAYTIYDANGQVGTLEVPNLTIKDGISATIKFTPIADSVKQFLPNPAELTLSFNSFVYGGANTGAGYTA